MKKSVKILLALLVIIACFLAVAMIYVMMLDAPDRPNEGKENSSVLSSPEDLLPRNIYIGRVPPDTRLLTVDGKAADITDHTGSKGSLIIFFASWCGDCEQQLQSAEAIEQEAAQAGLSVIYIDRLNKEKESVENALNKLSEHNAKGVCLIDEDEKLYKSWGIKEIPSEVVISNEGKVLAFDNGVLNDGEMRGLIDKAVNGPDRAGIEFMKAYMINNGAVSTELNGENGVLSESEGLLLQYADITEDEALFKEVFNAAGRLLSEDGLYAWRSDGTQKGGCNALLDDLRIYRALINVPDHFSDTDKRVYSIAAKETAQAIADRLVNDDKELVDYISFETGDKAEQLSLCYIDVETLYSIAAQISGFEEPVSKAEELLTNGYISDEFPLYYSAYDYKSGQYKKDSLNSAEALYTLWNLSRAGLLNKSSHEWLLKNVKDGTLYAEYNTDGTVTKGGHFHSTAVYALSALIGISEKDSELVQRSLEKMERYRIEDMDKKYYGAFMSGSSAAAFDQLMPLLVYGSMTFGEE